jgi:hypothetical protein
MPEAIMGAVWAFSWGVVAASGALVGAILGLTANLRHRAIAAFMSLVPVCCFRQPRTRSRPRRSYWPARRSRLSG